MRDVQSNVTLVVTSVAAALLLFEIAARLFLPQPGFIAALSPPGLLEPHPLRGYAYSPGFDGRMVTDEYDIGIKINELGLRDDPISSDQNALILAVGDSFTAGFGVEADEAWPSKLEGFLHEKLGQTQSVRVLNGGVSGYSLKQIHLLTRELAELNPNLVIVGLYTSRYWRLENPYVYWEGEAVRGNLVEPSKIVDGGFIRSPIAREDLKPMYFFFSNHWYMGAHLLWTLQQLRHWIIRSKTASIDNGDDRELAADLDPLLRELAQLRDMLGQRGINLVVLLVSHQLPDSSFADRDRNLNKVVLSWCSTNGVSAYDPQPYLEASANGRAIYRIGLDHHWSAAAHREVARNLGEFLLRRHILDDAPY